jgi:sorbitol/mannitol transport system permease protein
MIVLTQIPFLLAVWFSLHAWNEVVPSEGFPFVGLANYVTEFVSDPNFWPIIFNTVQLVVGSILLALIAGTILALLLNRPIWGRGVLRAVTTVPFLVTPAAMALIWKNLFLSRPSFCGLVLHVSTSEYHIHRCLGMDPFCDAGHSRRASIHPRRGHGGSES